MKQRGSFGNILLCIFEIVIGVLLFINPVGFTTAIIMGCGALLILFGIWTVINYFKTDPAEAVVGQNLMKGLVAVLSGAFCASSPGWFISAFPILTLVYGVVMLICGLAKVQHTVDLVRLKKSKWYIAAAGAAISVVCAVIIMKNPFATTAALWIFTGITLIVEAIIDILSLFINGREKKPIK